MSEHYPELPEPLTTPDCDLRGLPYMPLRVAALRESDLATMSTGDEFKAAVMLWTASWSEVPAGSLKDDDRWLAGKARIDLATWSSVKEMALHGWVKCSDGRLYHPVISALALEALPGHRAFCDKRDKGVTRKRKEREDRAALFEVAKRLQLPVNYQTKTTDLRAMVSAAEKANLFSGDDGLSLTGHAEKRDVSRDNERDQLRDLSHVEGVTSDVTSGVTVTAIKEKEKYIPPNPPFGGCHDLLAGFDDAWKILHDSCRGPADLDEARAQWSAILESGAVSAAGLLQATKAMTSAVERSGGRMAVQAFHRWLKSGKWRNWPNGAEAAAQGQPWSGPEEVRNAIIAFVASKQGRREEGIAFAATWLDKTTTWSDVPQAIVCLSSTVEKKLRSVVGRMLADEHGVQVRMATVGESA